MASLGGLHLVSPGDAFDSAAAFFLASAPKRPVSWTSRDAEIAADPGNPYVVCRFRGATSIETVAALGNRFVQRCLDMLSILGDADLIVRDAAEEHIVAWHDQDRLNLAVCTAIVQSVDVPPVTIVHKDKYGNIVPTTQPEPRHHAAFRYFRLSQATDDLFEAYRNMYLAFELLVSDAVPMNRRERERDWLQRALHELDARFNFGRFFRHTPTDTPTAIVDRVYTQARLPLFHAKRGRWVFAPHESQEQRDMVLAALQLLTKIVLELARRLHDARRMGGGVFQAGIHERIRQLVDGCSVVALTDAEPLSNVPDDRPPSTYRDSLRLVPSEQSDINNPLAPVLWAATRDRIAHGYPPITKFMVVKDDALFLGHDTETQVACDAVDQLHFRLSYRIDNVRMPRERFSR